MMYDVIVIKNKDMYTARVKDWPEVRVKATSRERAIRQVKARLLEYLSRQIEVVQVEIPLPEPLNNPWFETYGWFQDDPTFEDMQTEIAAYRKEIDAEHIRGAAS